MRKWSDINVQKLFPPVIYRRGLEYYNRGKVGELVYDLNHHIWAATVRGTEPYLVEINTENFESGSIETTCDCPAYETYGSCKHIAAALIKLVNRSAKREGKPSPPAANYQYQMMDNFIQALSGIEDTTSQEHLDILPKKVPMKVEYYVKWSPAARELQLELKTGETHAYVVKDVHDFLRNVFHGRGHYFTEKFTYHPDTHYFLPEDREVLELLQEIYINEQIYQGNSFYGYGNNRDRRHITIPPLAAKELLEKLAERSFTVEYGRTSYRDVQTVEDDLPFEFALMKNDEGQMHLQLEGANSAVYFEPYGMLFYDGTFYFPKKEQLPVLQQVSRFGMSQLELPIAKAQADRFLSEVLPSLKKIGGVEIAESVQEEIIQVPLKAKLYLELKDGWMVGKLEYHYGEHVVDPFNGRKQHDVFIIRDVEKEQQIMRLIEHADFHYNGKELYMEMQEEEMYDFLYHVLPLLDDYVELFLTQEIRSLVMESAPALSTQVGLESSNNLLDIGFDIEGVDDQEITKIIEAVIEKKRYYRLQTGELMSLEGEEFSSMHAFFDSMKLGARHVEEDGHIQLPVYRSMQVDELIGTETKSYDPAFRKLLNQLKHPEEQVYELPENLQASLRNYQHTGYQWFKSLSNYQLGGILADDMGLGKTLQSIAYIASEPGEQPHLIVTPSSVVYNWKNECSKFAPDLDVAVMTGLPQERHSMMEERQGADVWITSYATLRQDIEHYRNLDFQTLILDEAQFIKNHLTKTSRAVQEIKAGRRFALSGTPIENSIDELWAIFQVILPSLLPPLKEFKKLSNEKIGMLTRPFILRRLKQEVLKELPDKIDTVQVSELTKEQKDLYVGYHRQLQHETAQTMQQNSFNQNRMKILAGLTRLRQLCCHPSLFIENYEGQSGKLEQLMETIDSGIENGKRMLIFSQFTSMHEIIMQKLEEAGIDYFYLHGGTASEERVAMSERFNQGEKPIFLISLKAGGTGLNLTGADTVILYDLWWNPAVEDQAAGRAHRFGQKKVVQVIRLITEGTIEEKIYELQQKKRELIDQVIQPGETMLTSLSENDIRELLSI
ncbi:SNF2 helicase associated domain-containing protein [Lentibacillus sediminis]|uniref:DEAD/DEAH box helicase n=1 Tax=Lentibacillus sediminis TaxID=1940529 RepID=UPI000C1C44C3|nr:DEAD/DEAH box helicase [Lentibacillus sediminis]